MNRERLLKIMKDMIAIIMTVRNRKEITRKCIQSIINANKNKYNLTFYITNDGSTDGTEIMLQEEKDKNQNYKFIISNGDGNQYWVGGMRISYGKALENDNIDYYLWVNDDVEFFENFFDVIMEDYKMLHNQYEKFLIVGPVKDKNTGETTYSAYNINSKKIYRYYKNKIAPIKKVQECNVISGNCMLIDKITAKYIGNIDDRFIHMFGDAMYGFKLIDLGGKCFLASDYVGYCSRNSKKNTWQDESLSPIKRIKLKHDKKFHVPKLYIIYLKRVFGRKWLAYFIYQYVYIFVTSFKYKIKKILNKKKVKHEQ